MNKIDCYKHLFKKIDQRLWQPYGILSSSLGAGGLGSELKQLEAS